ncbi:MAG: DUF4886 domain-containing protein [Oscillospiraceae bacterium]|nr:DUF4886 domain-containing protein [Oscillospiraceae bacterium]
MKKRILATILTLAILLSVIVVPAWAENPIVTENVTAPATTICGCGCGKKLSEVEWKPWTGEVASGHFYLTEDQTVAEAINVISGESMVLDLRGYTITTSARVRTFLVNGYLGVLDTVGGGRISGRTASGENGGLVYVADNETTGSAFELFSGTLTPATDAGKPNAGGLIGLGDGATFRMHDGLLLNGATSTGSSKNGGAISAGATSTIEILGGSIVGCSADAVGGSIYSSGTVTLKDCALIGGTAGSTGGNLYISGTLTAENCTIAGGTAMATGTYGGGNINTASGSKLTFTNCDIYGGYCPGYGGNISFGWGTQTLTNTRVYGGVSGKGGDNIALTHTSANMTLNNCTVDGGMSRILGKLTLKGATKIGLTSGGLNISEQGSKATVATGLTSGAEVYVSGNKTLTGSLDYIKPALNHTLTASGTTLTVAPAADGDTAGYCPHCMEKVAWQPYGTANATHTYLSADMADFAEATVSSDLVIDLRGFDITATGRAFHVTATGSLTLIDSTCGAIVTGSGVAGEQGGVIANAGTLKLYGGKYVYASGKTVSSGGILYSSGNFEMHNVILDASAFANSAETAYGGAICTGSGVTATITGGLILGGTAYMGGGAYFDANNTVTLNAVNVKEGSAFTGGNLTFRGTTAEATGNMALTGCTITTGAATGEYAGNLYMGRYSSCAVTDCYIAGGNAEKYGGNFSVGLGTNTVMTNCILEGATADSKGGQVYLPGNTSKLTLDRCLMTNGTAPMGGNIYVNNGYLTIKGGEVSYGTSTGSAGGNIYTATDDGTGTTLTTDTNGNAPRICNGTAKTSGGNIYAGVIVNIDAAKISHGSALTNGNDLFVSGASANVTLGAGVTGDIYMSTSAALLTENVYGGAISNITCRTTDANLYLDGAYGNCGTLVKDNTIYVATTAVVDKDGNAIWYSSNADAVTACDDKHYIKLFTGNDLVLTKDLYVDLNGNTVNVSGDYTLYGMDASGDDFSLPTGKAILSGTVGAATVTAPNGNTYIAVEDTYHRLDMKITGVTVRPSADGMYYSAKWACDDVLKEKIATFGVVASTQDMPDSNFTSDDANLWTTYTKEAFQSGAAKTGAVISGIMSAETPDENNDRGRQPVYAKAYVTFTDGTSLVSNDNIGYSLYDVMKNLDKLITEKPIKYRKYNLSARNFFEKWKDSGMGNWNLSKIPAPADDGVIDVLMVGSSFCYYYVEELYALGQAAGIDIRVCNLYYSGCPLEKHYNWWVGGNSNYQYYETFHDGRNLTSNVSLEWGLAQHEWDFISIQESSGKTADEGAQLHYENTKQYWEPLLNYFLEQFPDTQVLWHQTWVNQFADHKKEGTVIKSPEDQIENTRILEDYAKLITGYFNDGQEETLVQRVPSGRAWQNVRDGGYDFLCCRLNKTNPVSGVAHAGDGYHEGDIGGGQYLNACVWFEIITGKSVVGNTYIPEYKTTATLADSLLAQVRVDKTANGYAVSEELVAILQQAAHDAVASTGFVVTE